MQTARRKESQNKRQSERDHNQKFARHALYVGNVVITLVGLQRKSNPKLLASYQVYIREPCAKPQLLYHLSCFFAIMREIYLISSTGMANNIYPDTQIGQYGVNLIKVKRYTQYGCFFSHNRRSLPPSSTTTTTIISPYNNT